MTHHEILKSAEIAIFEINCVTLWDSEVSRVYEINCDTPWDFEVIRVFEMKGNWHLGFVICHGNLTPIEI